LNVKKERGAVVYVNKDLESTAIEVSNSGSELVLLTNGKRLTIGNMYRSPNSSRAD